MACMMSSGRERQQQRTLLNFLAARQPTSGGGGGVERFCSSMTSSYMWNASKMGMTTTTSVATPTS
eukprot:7862139-Heterocapsa_arctica.AAC.1